MSEANTAAQLKTSAQTKQILKEIFEALLRLLHPIMPFISEELWQQTPRSAQFNEFESIMFAPFPRPDTSYLDELSAADMELLMRTIRAIRNIRQTYSVAPTVAATALIACKEDKEKTCLQNNEEYIRKLARLSELTIDNEVIVPALCASEPVYSSKIYMPLSSLIDTQKSKNKLVQRKNAVGKEVIRISSILEGGEFKFKAPKDKVDSLESQLAELNGQMQSIDSQLEVLERV
jgi:valyl-tRNA synthetase